MRIQDMFAKGIDRPINGVVKVNQDELDILVQELDEYVITRELKKHMIVPDQCASRILINWYIHYV